MKTGPSANGQQAAGYRLQPEGKPLAYLAVACSP